MKTKRELTAPCGIDCFNCEMYEANISPQARAFVAQKLGKELSDAACKGCRESSGCRLFYGGCATLDCVKSKGHEFCFECAEFPCGKLLPAADGADKYPHNIKLYNLCRMKAIGVDAWADSESQKVRQSYFKGKFVVGAGPQV